MVRRRSRSDAEAAAEGLLEFLIGVPAWVGPLLALGVYLFFGFLLPGVVGTEPPAGIFVAVGQKLSPLLAGFVVLLWIMAELKKLGTRRLLDNQSDIQSLRSMSWQELERLVGEAFRRRGYRVEERGGAVPDGGVDLVLHKGGEKTLVQCKDWKVWRVGVRPVRELRGVMASEGAARGIVVTCGGFTRAARAFGAANSVELVNGEALWRLVESVRAGKSAEPARVQEPAVAPAAQSATPLCPQCNSAMVLRTARRGPNPGSEFYGCSRYPACRGTRAVADTSCVSG